MCPGCMYSRRDGNIEFKIESFAFQTIGAQLKDEMPHVMISNHRERRAFNFYNIPLYLLAESVALVSRVHRSRRPRMLARS